MACTAKENTENISILAGSLRWKLQMQTISLLARLNFGIRAQQDYRFNLLAAQRRAQTVDDRFSGERTAEFNRVESVALRGKAEVFRAVAGGVGVVERARRDLGWALAINLPWTSAVNSFAVHRQPRTYIPEDLLHSVGDGAIRLRTDVQQEIAVLADDVDELLNHELRGLERVVLDVSPGFVAYRRVGLPVQGANVGELSALQVEDRGVLLDGPVFVVDDANVVAVFERGVVVERRKAGQVRTDGRLADPPVEVHDVGMVLLNDLERASEPVVCPGGGDV